MRMPTRCRWGIPISCPSRTNLVPTSSNLVPTLGLSRANLGPEASDTCRLRAHLEPTSCQSRARWRGHMSISSPSQAIKPAAREKTDLLPSGRPTCAAAPTLSACSSVRSGSQSSPSHLRQPRRFAEIRFEVRESKVSLAWYHMTARRSPSVGREEEPRRRERMLG